MHHACFFVVLFVAFASASPPSFDSRYSVAGNIRLPYAEIVEPFQAYYEPSSKKSRIDYYGDLVQTIQREDTQVGYKLAFTTNANRDPEKACFAVNASSSMPLDLITIQTVFPNLTEFSYAGEVTCPTIEASCDLWTLRNSVGQKENRYSFWSRNGNDSDAIPVQYEMMGYDSLLGSHYDKYILEYTHYSTGSIDPSTFEVQNISCTVFPGPGVSAHVSMNPMSVYIDHVIHREHVDGEFQKFKRTHGKRYEHDVEEANRKHIFRQNLRFVESKNRATLGYTLAVNHLADLNDDERRILRGRRYSGVYNGGRPMRSDFSNEELRLGKLPENLDWRLMGAVNPVQDQAICGSCWSFGTTGTIEGTHFVQTGTLVKLSQQQLMDCSWNEGNNACDGGEDFRAYDYLMKAGGQAREEDYGQYLGQDGRCHDKSVPKTVVITGFVNVTSGDANALQVALFNRGPVTVAIDASHKSLSFYANGVYYEPKCGNTPDSLDHSVLAVGYGSMNGKMYWLIKNSWSTYWGNDGYVLMSMENNNCGVTTDATYPIYY